MTAASIEASAHLSGMQDQPQPKRLNLTTQLEGTLAPSNTHNTCIIDVLLVLYIYI